MRDVDFSSAEHLTAPEDDPISLHFHEWTYGSSPLSTEALLLVGEPVVPDPHRAAAAFLVRYLRFGGRKLAYKIVNSQGFAVRFAYDNPHFYFQRLTSDCRRLSVPFVDQHEGLFALVDEIARASGEPNCCRSKPDRNRSLPAHLRRIRGVLAREPP